MGNTFQPDYTGDQKQDKVTGGIYEILNQIKSSLDILIKYVDGKVKLLRTWIFQHTHNGTDSAAVSHTALSNLGNDDHAQYLRTDGTRALTGDMSAGNKKITNLANGVNAADAVNFSQLSGAGMSVKKVLARILIGA